jgi:hypothetical protein
MSINADHRKLLEFVARAMGIEIEIVPIANGPDMVVAKYPETEQHPTDGYHWNPIEDDGDCARIEAKLGLLLSWEERCVRSGQPDITGMHAEWFANHGEDRNAARRLASVRAAAVAGMGVDS